MKITLKKNIFKLDVATGDLPEIGAPVSYDDAGIFSGIHRYAGLFTTLVDGAPVSLIVVASGEITHDVLSPGDLVYGFSCDAGPQQGLSMTAEGRLVCQGDDAPYYVDEEGDLAGECLEATYAVQVKP